MSQAKSADEEKEEKKMKLMKLCRARISLTAFLVIVASMGVPALAVEDLDTFAAKNGLVKTEGLFDVYEKADNGKMYLALDVDTQLEKEFVFATRILDGSDTPRTPIKAGKTYPSNIVVWRRMGRLDYMALWFVDHHYESDPGREDAALNLPRSLAAISDIVAESDDGKTILIDFTSALSSESLQKISKDGLRFERKRVRLTEPSVQIVTFLLPSG